MKKIIFALLIAAITSLSFAQIELFECSGKGKNQTQAEVKSYLNAQKQCLKIGEAVVMSEWIYSTETDGTGATVYVASAQFTCVRYP